MENVLGEVFKQLVLNRMADASAADKVKFASKFQNVNNLLDHSPSQLKIQKCDEKSEEYRNQGNTFFAKDEYVDAVEMYNKSLCFAKSSVNLAHAYANRSAVCFMLKMYSTCMANIDLAKMHKYPADKMIRLDERAEKCRAKIAEGAESDETMLKPSGEEFLKLSHPSHPKLPYIADCLDVQSSKVFGRHVVTKKKLLPGEIIAIESPFSKHMLPTKKYKVCFNCLSNDFLSLIPCSSTTSVMFCSAKCIKEANDSSFKYQADIIDKLNQSDTYTRAAVEMFFQSLKACNGSLAKLKKITENNKKNPDLTIFDVDNPHYQINRYRAIDALNTHEDQRERQDQLERGSSIAETVTLFLENTKLGKLLRTEDDQDFFRSFLYKHSQIASVNFKDLGLAVAKKDENNSKQSTSIGSFPFLSLINHSCNGNVYLISGTRSLYLVVLRVIEPGEQLFDTYGPYFDQMDKKARQDRLRQKYFFNCKCVACRKDLIFENLNIKVDEVVLGKQMEIIAEMQDFDADKAKKTFKEICRILTKNARINLCYSLMTLEKCAQRCYMMFFMSKLFLHLFKWKSESFDSVQAQKSEAASLMSLLGKHLKK